MILPMIILMILPMVFDGRCPDDYSYCYYDGFYWWVSLGVLLVVILMILLMGSAGYYSDGCSDVYSDGFYWLLVRSLISGF